MFPNQITTDSGVTLHRSSFSPLEWALICRELFSDDEILEGEKPFNPHIYLQPATIAR